MAYVRHYGKDYVPESYDLPFRLKVNFKKLVLWWKEQANSTVAFESEPARGVLKRIEKIPELFDSFENTGLIEEYQEEIQYLLSPFFPHLPATTKLRRPVSLSDRCYLILQNVLPIFWMVLKGTYISLSATLISCTCWVASLFLIHSIKPI